jgi:uncharacterized membrane protein
MIKILSTALVAAVIALPLAANAAQLHNRIENQQDRINQGVQSGQLTRHEYNVDERRLNSIRRQRDGAIDNKNLSPAERAKLNRELNRSSNGVYFTKHNRADQPGI